MLDKFIDDLDFYCTERLSPPENRLYQKQMARLEELEQQIIAALGPDFYEEFQQLIWDSRDWALTAHFREGLKFGVNIGLIAVEGPAK